MNEDSPNVNPDSLDRITESPIVISDAMNSTVKGLPSSNLGTPVASSTQNHGSRLLADQIRDVTETLLREEKERTFAGENKKEQNEQQEGLGKGHDVKICELKPTKNAIEVIMENPQSLEQAKMKRTKASSGSRKKTDEVSSWNILNYISFFS